MQDVHNSDLLVFSHLRWDFVFQRPQHLLSRFANHRRVYYIEEPVFGMTELPRLHLRTSAEGVNIVIPYLMPNTPSELIEENLRELLDDLIETESITKYSAWYYTPMALSFTRHLRPQVTIFDCMDELSLFKGAPRSLIEKEKELMSLSDVVFTGGHSLYEAKKNRHHNIHPFPSSIDYKHFHSSRSIVQEPADQKDIPHPRIGFYGVIDERMDLDLLAGIADARADFHYVIIGPVVKIDPASLPQRANIHYLGKKEYADLPSYLSGWDCAMMPFALNDSTRFISPTKTPEYLAAGKPIVSTSIKDVVNPYWNEGLVHIADSAEEFTAAIEKAMKEKEENPEWLLHVDLHLSSNSWDQTFMKMAQHEIDLLDVEIHNVRSESRHKFTKDLEMSTQVS